MIYMFLILFTWCCHFFELLLLTTFTLIYILLHYKTFCLFISVSEIHRRKHVYLHKYLQKWCKKENLTLLTEAKFQTDFIHVIITNSLFLSPLSPLSWIPVFIILWLSQNPYILKLPHPCWILYILNFSMASPKPAFPLPALTLNASRNPLFHSLLKVCILYLSIFPTKTFTHFPMASWKSIQNYLLTRCHTQVLDIPIFIPGLAPFSTPPASHYCYI